MPLWSIRDFLLKKVFTSSSKNADSDTVYQFGFKEFEDTPEGHMAVFAFKRPDKGRLEIEDLKTPCSNLANMAEKAKTMADGVGTWTIGHKSYKVEKTAIILAAETAQTKYNFYLLNHPAPDA